MANIRETALQALQNSLEKHSFLNLVNEDGSELSPSEAAYANMLCLSAFRNLAFIRSLLKTCLKKKLPNKAAPAEYALILGITEILFLNTPDYAAINSWVEIAKKKTDKFIGNMVNAVLRRICREKDTITDAKKPFFPQSFREILKSDYTPETILAMGTAAAAEPPLALSVKSEPEKWAEMLRGKHLAANTVILSGGGKISALPGYADGSWWVQDFAASLPVTVLGNIQGKQILDLCAAPGGKTAQLLSRGANVTSLDISEERLQTLRQNIERLRLPAPKIIAADAAEYLTGLEKPVFDIIVLDAPCSATGIFRRHPELLHFKTKTDIQNQAAIQKQILEAASKALLPGGILVYAVCSVAKAEGESQIRRFLQNNPGFSLIPLKPEDIDPAKTEEFSELFTKEGFIRTLPHMLPAYGGLDSFFIAKLQKEK